MIGSFAASSGHKFQQQWEGGSYPRASSSCGAACTRTSSNTCICNTTEATTAVYTDAASIPPAHQLEQELFIGAPDPGIFPSGTYSLTTKGDVEIYNPVGNGATLGAGTVFKIVRDTEEWFFANKKSMVSVGDGVYSFRNPPHFMSFLPGWHSKVRSPYCCHSYIYAGSYLVRF